MHKINANTIKRSVYFDSVHVHLIIKWFYPYNLTISREISNPICRLTGKLVADGVNVTRDMGPQPQKLLLAKNQNI